MKKLSSILFGSILTVMLSGCGDSGGGGDMNSLMGGGGDMDMGALMGGGGDMDMSALMGGGGMDMSMLMGGGGDDGGGGGGGSNPPPPSYSDKGDVFIMYEGKEYFLKAVSSPEPSIVQPSFEQDENGDYTVTIAGYDTRNNTVNLGSGYLVFTFLMPNIETTGMYELASPAHKSGYVRVDRAKFYDDGSLNIKGVIKNAEIYSMDKSATFNIEIAFDVDLVPKQPSE